MGTKVPAFVVKQWLKPEWDETRFEPAPPRGKPKPYFFLFTISAYTLKKLSGIYRRDPQKPPAQDMGVQRRHLPDRSDEILRYLQNGFPLSRIDKKRFVDESEKEILRMPGWLPTAVIANILVEGDKRGPRDTSIEDEDRIKVHYSEGQQIAEIELPDQFGDDWQPIIHPLEIIDGQHRLWAFEEPEEDKKKWPADLRERISSIEIPVVAFWGLDRTWQGYLFYTINQLPDRINASLVFDLYPLLRTQEWLLKFEGPNIYRETRAQDLTILLWGHPESPWKDRILRHGGRERGKVAQAAFIRSLIASFIKRWDGGGGNRIGGLFGSPLGSHETHLNWGREQQAAFLIIGWQVLKSTIVGSSGLWATKLVERCMKRATDAQGESNEQNCREALFSGPETLIATDQGVRGYLHVLNDLFWIAYESGVLNLNNWDWARKPGLDDYQAVTDAVHSFQSQLEGAVAFARSIAEGLQEFDFRLASTLSPDDPQRNQQAAYRGSSGYREIRRNMLVHLRGNASSPVKDFASQVIERLNFEPEEED